MSSQSGSLKSSTEHCSAAAKQHFQPVEPVRSFPPQRDVTSASTSATDDDIRVACDESLLTRNDIGLVMKNALTTAEIAKAVSFLDNGKKYALLFEHVNPRAVLPSRWSIS